MSNATKTGATGAHGAFGDVAAPGAYLPPGGPPRAEKPVLRFFVADLHLDGTDSPRAQHFHALLRKAAAYCAEFTVQIFIVGDLFEFWYEYRRALFELYARDLAALEAAWRAGVQIFLFYGNRDFAYGSYVRKRFGATVLGDGSQIALSDCRPLWMEHGDLLCTADTRYLRFRGVIRSSPVRVLFFLMPWSMARRTIQRIRARTTADKAAKPRGSIAIDLDAARARLQKQKCRVLLCGHTHKPESVELGQGLKLIVLPPWCDGPRGYLDDGRSFRPFLLDELK